MHPKRTGFFSSSVGVRFDPVGKLRKRRGRDGCGSVGGRGSWFPSTLPSNPGRPLSPTLPRWVPPVLSCHDWGGIDQGSKIRTMIAEPVWFGQG